MYIMRVVIQITTHVLPNLIYNKINFIYYVLMHYIIFIITFPNTVSCGMNISGTRNEKTNLL